MDNIIIGNQSLTDSDYESSDEEPENINYHNIDYDNKYFHNNSLQSEYQTTRNKLFTKDIIKQRILIDTHNIKVQGTDISQSLKTNNYTYFLYKNSEEAHSSTENYNETGGYDRYKNVMDSTDKVEEMFKGMSPYAERKDYVNFLSSVYTDRIKPIIETENMLVPKRKPLNQQMDYLQ